MPARPLELREGLWQVTLAGYVNCFLVLDEGGLTLVDTGLPTSARALLAAAAQVGAPIARVVLTHTHRDHAGGLDALLASAHGAELWLTRRAAEQLGGRFVARPGEPQAPPRRALFSHARSRPTGRLRDGDRVGRLTVVTAPGHSPEHVAYYDERRRVLIAGDAFTTKGDMVTLVGQRRGRAPLAGLVSALVTWDLPTAVATAARLRALQPDLLLVGHGPPLERPARQLERALAAAEPAADRLGRTRRSR